MRLDLDYPDESGVTRREQITLSNEQAGKVPGWQVKEIIEPDVPLGFERIWRLFWVLSGGRGSSGFGASPIPYSEIRAYCELMREGLTPYDVQYVKLMDAEYLKFVAEKTRERRKKAPAPPH